MIEKTFNTGSLTLNFAEGSPAGPPLLVLHGLAGKWQTFYYLLPELAKHWHLYALDLRGHGKSGWADSYRIHDYVPDIVSFIKNQIKEPVMIFGHSFGGMIAIMLAAAHPDLVKGLVIGDSLISPEFHREFSRSHKPVTEFWRELAKTKDVDFAVSQLKNQLIPVPGQPKPVPAHQVLGEDHPSFRFTAECFCQLDPEVLTAEIEFWGDTYAQYQPDRLFPKIPCPVLLVQGNRELGSLMMDEHVVSALNLLPKGRHVRIPKAGHMIIVEDTETVLKAVVPFLQSV